jgi:hypothetical protein
VSATRPYVSKTIWMIASLLMASDNPCRSRSSWNFGFARFIANAYPRTDGSMLICVFGFVPCSALTSLSEATSA